MSYISTIVFPIVERPVKVVAPVAKEITDRYRERITLEKATIRLEAEGPIR